MKRLIVGRAKMLGSAIVCWLAWPQKGQAFSLPLSGNFSASHSPFSKRNSAYSGTAWNDPWQHFWVHWRSFCHYRLTLLEHSCSGVISYFWDSDLALTQLDAFCQKWWEDKLSNLLVISYVVMNIVDVQCSRKGHVPYVKEEDLRPWIRARS